MAIADWLWIGLAALWVPMDVLIVLVWHQPTESDRAKFYGKVTTAFPYALGVLVGHWELNTRQPITSAWGIAMAPELLLGCWDAWWNLSKAAPTRWRSPWLWVPVGMVLGALFWGQADPTALFR